jgi:hypothetical protein
MMSRSTSWAFLISLFFLAVVYAQKKPEISVKPSQVKAGASVMLTGTGFTPNRTAMSHLRRPDGTEYNPLRLRTDQHGELVHNIDTSMMSIGTFELWVEDEAVSIVSNRIQFTVE